MRCKHGHPREHVVLLAAAAEPQCGHLVDAELVVLSAGGPNSDVALPFPQKSLVPQRKELSQGTKIGRMRVI